MFNKPANPFSRPQEPAARDLLASQSRSTTSTIQPGNPASSTSSTARPASTTPNAGNPVAPAQNSDTLGETGSRLIVGPDVKLKSAEILDCDTLVVEGRVEATMDSRVIRIADRGVYSGKVSIDIAEIHGQFEGELTARSQLIIHATGKVSGKIRYGKILIEEGGQISGEIKSLAEEESPVIRPRTEILANLKAAVG